MQKVIQFKNVFRFGILVAGFLTTTNAQAISDSCTLLNRPVPAAASMSSSGLRAYTEKLQKECELTNRFRSVREAMQVRYGVGLENVNEYQAMRFVRRVNFEDSKWQNIPVEKTYQILRSNYSLPIEQRSSIIWDNWEIGISYLGISRDKLLNRQQFTVEDLKRIHMNFFQLSKEVGDDAHVPDEGVFKPAHNDDNYWWDFASEYEAQNAIAIVNQINEHHRQMGLIPVLKKGDHADVLRVKLVPKRDHPSQQVWAIYSGDSRVNQMHVRTILNFVNNMIDQALTGNHMVWKGQLMTPAEVAYFAQKFYVGVHPFSEGNGRTSRFIQELFLMAFDMPHGSSGDLMDIDVLTTFEDYYRTAIDSNLRLIGKMEDCLSQYQSNRLKNADRIRNNGHMIDYSCRLIK